MIETILVNAFLGAAIGGVILFAIILIILMLTD